MMSRELWGREFCADLRTYIGAAIICATVPSLSYATPSTGPSCHALVSIANDLYLVQRNGKILTRFTSDGLPKIDITLSSSGDKVAYVSQQGSGTSYQVVDRFGRVGIFPIYDDEGAKSQPSSGRDAYEAGALVRLSWSSDDVLTLIKHVSPGTWRFEFHRIRNDLSPPASMQRPPSFGEVCTAAQTDWRVACLDQEGDVFIGRGGSLSGQTVFSMTGYDGVAPEETILLSAGNSVITSGDPAFKVQVLTVNHDGISLQVTPPNGVWSKMYNMSHGMFLDVPWKGAHYGFFPATVNTTTGSVRVSIVRIDSSTLSGFEGALAWAPRAQGLMLIRRLNSQTFLYLIRPGRDDSRLKEGKRGKWELAAQVPILLPGEIDFMRFATPDLLLLKDHFGRYYKLPIQIGGGRGAETLTVGTVTPLPSTIAVQLNGATTQGTVLDWSCSAQRGVGTGS